MTPLTKVCTKCGIRKTLDQFHKSKGRPTGTSQCKECRNRMCVAWNQAHPETVKACQERYRKTEKCKEKWRRQRKKDRAKYLVRYKQWRARNPEKCAQYRFEQTLRYYGLTLESYMELVKTQKNCCAICRSAINGKQYYGKKRLGIDHDHKTKKVRGLLCINCNLLIGHSHDSPELLRKAADYLERFQEAVAS